MAGGRTAHGRILTFYSLVHFVVHFVVHLVHFATFQPQNRTSGRSVQFGPLRSTSVHFSLLPRAQGGVHPQRARTVVL